MSFDHIGVLGAGAWGTALANVAAKAGRRVTLWGLDHEIEAIARTRQSPFLPGIDLHERVRASAALDEVVNADALMVVVPAQVVREIVAKIAPRLDAGKPLIVCSKGIERGTRKFMSEIIADVAPHAAAAVLSGPSFAIDVARDLPTAVTLAAHDADLAAALSYAIGSPNFRPYQSTDIRGVELGGAAKNVIAIAAGIVTGRRLGASASAAVITRGFAEMQRFGRAYGARPETLAGLSGLGDLVLTCSSPQSRNFSLGKALGEGRSLAEAQSAGMLAEGAFTAAVLAEMAQERNIDMPIAIAIDAVLEGRMTLDAAIQGLLARPVGLEE